MELLSHIVTSFFEDLPHCSPQWLHGFTLPPLAEEACFFPASSPASVICVLFDAGHSDRCGITSHCGWVALSLVRQALQSGLLGFSEQNSSEDAPPPPPAPAPTPLLLNPSSETQHSSLPLVPRVLPCLPSCRVCFVSLHTYFELCGLYLFSGFPKNRVDRALKFSLLLMHDFQEETQKNVPTRPRSF